MGVELVQGTDLFVDESITYIKQPRGQKRLILFIEGLMINLLIQLLLTVPHLLEFQAYLIHISLVM